MENAGFTFALARFEWKMHSKHCFDASSFTRPPPTLPGTPSANSTLPDYPTTAPPSSPPPPIIVPKNDSMKPTLNCATTAVQRGEFDAFILIISLIILF